MNSTTAATVTTTEISMSLPPASLTELTREKIELNGMRCAACAQLIEFRLMQLPGVKGVLMNYAAQRAEVSWEPAATNVHQIVDAVHALGYGALPAGDKKQHANRHKAEMWRLFVAGFAMMQVMMYAFPSYLVPKAEIGGDLSPDLDHLLKLACLALALPVLMFSSLPFFKSAWRDIKNRHVGMDVPVSVGIIATFTMSTWATFFGGHVYFDSMIMFVFLLLGGRMIESRVQQKSQSALTSLTQFSPNIAQYMPDFPASRQMQSVPAVNLNPGDYVMVPAGAQIPADGCVIEGVSDCDESWMTGESQPCAKQAGSMVVGGSINVSNPLIMQATQVADTTQFAHLLRMMESAANEKPPLVALADRHASQFLTVIMVLAVLSGIAWWSIDPSRAVWIAITVLVVTCPCALSLATPGVMSAVLGLLAKRGVLVARGAAIEGLARAEHIVFDKTGTLTQGKLSLQGHRFLRDDPVALRQALQVCAVMVAGSLHPVSKALAGHAVLDGEAVALGDAPVVDDLVEDPGQGMMAHSQGKSWRLGQVDYVQALHGYPLDIPTEFVGTSLCGFGDADGWIALFSLSDSLRPDALAMVQQLTALGKQLHILSGDNPDVVRRIADELQLQDAQGNLRPEQKYAAIQQMQKNGARVVMIGDGMNDGPGLSIADVSVAMGQGAPITQARSDVLLLSNRLLDFAYAVRMCTRALRLIKQNLAWAVLYNIVAIPAAVAGVIAPWHAAMGMSLSSLIVVLNSLRLLIGQDRNE